MDLDTIATFWVVALLLIIAPGPDWAFTLGAALRGNGVAAIVGGLVVGYAALTVVVVAGVGLLVAGSPGALTAITLGGGAYLIWVGAAVLRAPAGSLTGDATGSRTDRATFAQGIGVSSLNPKGLLLFVALLPQFTDAGSPWPVGLQMAVLGVAFTLSCAAFYTALGLLARRVLDARPGAARALRRVSGAGMAVIGAVLVLDRLLG